MASGTVSSWIVRKLSRVEVLRAAKRVYQTYFARQIVTKKIVEASNWKVLSGPFAGMVWGKHGLTWSAFDLGPQLLGTYEQDLHQVISSEIERKPPQIINLGCADGYYAVGMALACKDSEVWGIDIDAESLKHCLANANLNNIKLNVAQLLPDTLRQGAFWLVDVEGAEAEILDPEAKPVLKHCSVLVELHPFLSPGVKELIWDRFRKSHKIVEIRSGARNPNQFPFLEDIPDRLRWSVASEGRSQVMSWLYLNPKSTL